MKIEELISGTENDKWKPLKYCIDTRCNGFLFRGVCDDCKIKLNSDKKKITIK